MAESILFPPVRFVARLLAAVLLVLRAGAQSSDNRDPFEIMRGGLGNEMRSPQSQYPLMGENSTDWGVASSYDQARAYDLVQEVFVPPIPPAVGEGMASGPGRSPDERELFFGGQAVAAYLNKVTPKQNELLEVYRSNREQLLKEIHAKLEEVAGATPSVRRARLAEFATEQESRLRALAEEEEALRNDLAWVKSIFRIRVVLPGGGFRISQWVTSRRLVVSDPGMTPEAGQEAARLFTGAYFYGGLSTAQRLLLEEIGYEQLLAAKDGGAAGKASGPFLSFLPAMARIRVPAGLPPPLAEKIRDFAREKESLKTELRGAVLRDDFFLVSTRTRRLAALAEQQAPRLTALEILAEEIRVGLAAFDATRQRESENLPAGITQRMGRFNERKVAARRELLNQLRLLRFANPDASFDIVRSGDGLAIALTKAGAKPVAGLDEFNAGQAREYTDLAGESEVLRREIQRYLDGSPQRGTRTVDQLAGDFARAYAAREFREHHGEYARAVLEPGLSAAQRRLLFQSALVGPGKTDGSDQLVVNQADLHGPLDKTAELLHRSTP